MQKAIILRRRAVRARGYTLIEFAVVLVVAGLLIASFMSAYNLYLKTQAEQTTDQNISQMTATLSQFLIVFGSYPCPAPLDVPRTSPKYGVAGNCDPTSAGYDGPAVGTFGNGFYEQTTNRTLVSPPNPAGTIALNSTTPPTDVTTGKTLGAHSPKIRRGMIPFRSLGLTEDSVYDGYGMRLMYVVTEALAVPATYLRQAGAIDIQDGQGHSLVKAPGMPDAAFDSNVTIQTTGGSAHYVIFSTGEDRAGGYNYDGKMPIVCGAGIDGINCSQAQAAGIYNFAARSTAHTACAAPLAGADCHYDDHMKYYSEIESPLWQASTTLGKDITDVITASGGAAKIGIGAAPSGLQPGTLQVAGDVHASSQFNASQLCNGTGGSCVNTFLTSSCAAGTVATRLLNGQLQCAASSTGGRVTCPQSGEIFHGFNADGSPICKTVVTCPLQMVALCQPPTVVTADNRWLPSSEDGTVISTTALSPGGGSGTNTGNLYSETWKCSGGSWTRTATSGLCTCNANTSSYKQNCDAYFGKGTGTYSGQVTVTTTTTCPNGTTTTSSDTSQCACTATTSTSSTSTPCSTGYSGGPVVQTTNGTWSCPSAKWSYSNTTTGSCTCVNGSTQSQTVTCPTGYSGSVTQTSTLDCSTGTWGAWTPAMTNPPPSGCTCTGGTQYQTVGCGTGMLGTKTQQRTFNCSASPPDWTAWSDLDTSNCAAITYSWRPVGTPTSCGAPLSYNLYDTCTTSGQFVSCSAPNGASYTCYNNQGCECE